MSSFLFISVLEAEEIVAKNSGRPGFEQSTSVSSLLREERFEFVESSSLPPVTQRETTLLKTSSVPELGSFSGVDDLPDTAKFAEGVAPWPFEEATQSTGRYNLIREALEQSRKRKHNWWAHWLRFYGVFCELRALLVGRSSTYFDHFFLTLEEHIFSSSSFFESAAECDEKDF